MLVIAHRGASWDLPENTLPAFERAIEIGADYVELDVHATTALSVTHDRPVAASRYPDPRRGARPLPRPDRRDGRAQAPAPGHRSSARWTGSRRRRAALFPAPRRSRSRGAGARCSHDAARRLRRQHPPRGGRLGGRLPGRPRDSPRAAGRARARPADAVYTVNDEDGCASSTRSASPASSRIVRIERWHCEGLRREAEQPRALGGMCATTSRRPAAPRRARGHVGDQARTLGRSP